MLSKDNKSKISYYIVILLRIVGGTIFIPSGLLKIQGKQFSYFCPEMYKGTFFNELHHTGFYWNFLGFCQLLTAFLLFSQRYTVLAALMFISICTNIFVFTLSVGLVDKALIMVFMMCIASLLVIYDWRSISMLLGIVSIKNSPQNQKIVPVSLQITGIVLFTAVIILFLITDTYY